MDSPVLSIIIPTRERAQTLAFTVATALAQRSQNYEVVVSDNHSADDTRALMEAIDDPRLRYFRTSRGLSMCDNYEFALEQARGDHVIIIGDDDAVLPGRLDDLIARIARTDRPGIFMWPLHIYDWPAGGEPAALAYRAPTKAEAVLDLRLKARSVVRRGGWKYYELPSPYHAAVPRNILDQLRERTGRVFHSTQPDVFTAMAIPAFATTAINLGWTVTMNGRSPKSNGKDFTLSGARKNIDRFISEYGDYSFHDTLYPGASASANMIPDAILKAKDMFPEIYGDVPFGYDAMWAYVARLRFVPHADVILKSKDIRRSHRVSLTRFLAQSAVHEAAVWRRRLLNRLDRPPLGGDAIPDNILDFVRALMASDARGS